MITIDDKFWRAIMHTSWLHISCHSNRNFSIATNENKKHGPSKRYIRSNIFLHLYCCCNVLIDNYVIPNFNTVMHFYSKDKCVLHPNFLYFRYFHRISTIVPTVNVPTTKPHSTYLSSWLSFIYQMMQLLVVCVIIYQIKSNQISHSSMILASQT